MPNLVTVLTEAQHTEPDKVGPVRKLTEEVHRQRLMVCPQRLPQMGHEGNIFIVARLELGSPCVLALADKQR